MRIPKGPSLFGCLLLMVFACGSNPAAAAQPTTQEIAALVEQLGDDQYAVREEAQEQLQTLGLLAFEALVEATAHDDLEVASRARYLLRSVTWSRETDSTQVQELLQDYASLSASVRTERVGPLLELPDGDGYAAICRLVRYEESEMLSKRMAIIFLQSQPFDAIREPVWRAAIREEISPDTRRPAARWLVTCLDSFPSPRDAADAFAEQVEAEVRDWDPEQSEDGTTTIVTGLLYRLAEMQKQSGDNRAADKTAERARAIPPISPESLTAVDEHRRTAGLLQQRGLFAWAEAEYRMLLDTDDISDILDASMYLSAMQHDQGDDLGAAKTLETFLQALDNEEALDPTSKERSSRHNSSFRDYYLACHWLDAGDMEKHREYIEKATEADGTNVDVLIARHHIPNTSESFREETAQLVLQQSRELRMDMERYPTAAINFNQFAWLVGNAGGSFHEARAAAEKAVSIRPTAGAYLDTLAHVHYRQGNFEKAVEYQTEAVRYDPHSGLISRQLGVFRKAWEEQQAADAP